MSARRPPRSRTTKLSNDSGRRKPRSGSAEVWLVPVRTRAPLPLSRATILRFRGPRRESFGIKARPCTHQHALQLANNNKKKECWSALTKIGTLFKITIVQMTDLRVLLLKLDFMVSQRQSRITFSFNVWFLNDEDNIIRIRRIISKLKILFIFKN